MALIVIVRGDRVRECEEADLPHFAAQGYARGGESPKAEPEAVEPPKPVKGKRSK